MEPEGSLPFSQQPATGAYHEQHKPSSHPYILYRYHIIVPSTPNFFM